MTSNQMRIAIKTDTAASFWLQAAVVAAGDRDPVDALRDAERLLVFCQVQLGEAQS